MSLKYFVYVGSVNNLSDARHCSAMLVDCVGFNLIENSEKSISYKQIKEISSWISGVNIVGDFNDSSSDHINSIIKEIDFSYIKIDIDNEIENINIEDKKIIVRIPDLRNNNSIIADLENYYNNVEILVFDSFDDSNYQLINQLSKKYKVLIKHKKSLKMTINYLDKLNLGLYLDGSDEIRPGYKDYDSLSEILEKIDMSF